MIVLFSPMNDTFLNFPVYYVSDLCFDVLIPPPFMMVNKILQKFEQSRLTGFRLSKITEELVKLKTVDS